MFRPVSVITGENHWGAPLGGTIGENHWGEPLEGTIGEKHWRELQGVLKRGMK